MGEKAAVDPITKREGSAPIFRARRPGKGADAKGEGDIEGKTGVAG